MPWTNIEERLARPFNVRLSFPNGIVEFPATRLDIDEWLTSAAETDEELSELNIPRIRFLQNRWRMEKLVQFEWETTSSITRRAIWAMYVGRHAYILFSGGFKYYLIAAIEPQREPALYRAVIRRLLQNPDFVPTPPTHIRSDRPELVPDLTANEQGHPQSGKAPAKNGYLSNLLVGWIGAWIDLPVWGYWHQDDVTEPMVASDSGASQHWRNSRTLGQQTRPASH
jgi:hypothetical protein